MGHKNKIHFDFKELLSDWEFHENGRKIAWKLQRWNVNRFRIHRPSQPSSQWKGQNGHNIMNWNRDRFLLNLSLIRIYFIIVKLFILKGFLSRMMRIFRSPSFRSFGRIQARKEGGGKTHRAEETLIGIGVTDKV